MNILEKSKETAKILNINEKDALTLEFIAMETLAKLTKNLKAESLFHIAAKHSDGQISKQIKNKLFNTIK